MSVAAQPSAHERPYSVRHEIAQGALLILPAGLGMIPIGIAFGLLIVQSGLPWWMAPALSFFAYAGSLELLLITLITSLTPLVTIAAASFFVNFRHVFYAFNFPLKVVKNPFLKFYAMYSLTDEIFAVTVANPKGWTQPRVISAGAVLQICWVGGGLIGVLLSSFIPFQIRGLSFALCALFITLTLDACRTKQEIPSLLLGAAAFGLALLLLPSQPIFAAMIGFVATLAARYTIAVRLTRPLPAEMESDDAA